MLIDENERTANDGLWVPDANLDQIADRHETFRKNTQDPQGRGNAAFYDGHAEGVSRGDAHNPAYWDPSK